MSRLLFIFLDGVGLGTNENNPMLDLFKDITGVDFLSDSFPLTGKEFILKGIDPILGVEGIPQSATGQTSIMSGTNAQKELGYHLTAFPNAPLIDILKRDNLLKEAKEEGFRVTCANIYSREYFEKRSKRRKNMFPVSALSVKDADIPFRFYEDYEKGRAVFASITSSYDPIPPESAARNMLSIARDYDLTFFEYFLTDSYGHKKKFNLLEEETSKLNKFILSLWNEGKDWLDIIITSDHGNAEDNSTGEHTRNLVPLLLLSKSIDRISKVESSTSISDVKDLILKLLRYREV